MAKNKKSKSSFDKLLEEANAVSTQVENIKSIANNSNGEIVTDPATDTEPQNSDNSNLVTNQEINSRVSNDNKTDFEWFLNRRTVKDSESVRIPREVYKDLKTLSNITDSTMNSLIGNILEDFLKSYDKEIQNRKKRYIKEIG